MEAQVHVEEAGDGGSVEENEEAMGRKEQHSSDGGALAEHSLRAFVNGLARPPPHVDAHLLLMIADGGLLRSPETRWLTVLGARGGRRRPGGSLPAPVDVRLLVVHSSGDLLSRSSETELHGEGGLGRMTRGAVEAGGGG